MYVRLQMELWGVCREVLCPAILLRSALLLQCSDKDGLDKELHFLGQKKSHNFSL